MRNPVWRHAVLFFANLMSTLHTHTKKKDGRSDGSDDGASSASSGGARTPGAAERAEVRAVERKLSTADEFDVESPTATAE